MLKKLLIYLLLFLCSTSLYANYKVSYYDNKINHKNINEVLNKEFLPTTRKETFGKKKHLWLKVTIENDSEKEQLNYLSLRNIHIMMNVHFYTVKDGKVIKKDTTFHKIKNTEVPHRIGNILLYNNNIKVKEKIDVYIYITAGSNIYYEINNGNLTEVMSKASRSSATLVILTGILVALAIYYLFLYLLTPNKEYIYYSLLVFSMATWSFYVFGGYAYYFDIFSISAFVHIIMIFLPMFTTLFFQSIYKDNKEFKKYNKILNIYIFFLLAALVYEVLGRLGLYELRFKVTGYLAFIYIANLFTILIIALIIYLKKLPYSGLFLLAFTSNFIGVIVSISFFRAKIPYTEVTFYGNMIGSAFEAILFSILLTYKMRQVYKEKDEAQNLNKIQNFKMGIMSETIDFISHQWRQPLAQINGSIMAIDDIAYNKKYLDKELENELLSIEKTTNYMSTTIDDFRNLFSSKKKNELIDLNKVINNVSEIVKKSLNTKDINLDLQLENKLYFKGNQGELSQVLLILLNNAKDALIEKNIKESLIKIKLFSHKEKIFIELSDNAGGIDKEQENKIFDAYFTTKEKKQGSGLGLYIAKMLIETKMKGNIYYQNKDEGACFIIELEQK